jgi:two-component system response regulator FixJ
MPIQHRFYIVDGNDSRRAGLTRQLLNHGLHAEPYSDLAELEQRFPHDGVILVFDDCETLKPLLKRCFEAESWIPIIAYSEQPNPRRVVEAMTHGASDYVELPLDVPELIDRIGLLRAHGERQFELMRRGAMAERRLSELSPRELEVLERLTEGNTSKVIGRELNISHRTVEIHRAHILEKVGANNFGEAVRLAIEADAYRLMAA